MSVTTKALRQSAYVANAEADLFVATQKTIIDKCNSVAVLAGNVTLRIVQSGGTPGDEHRQAYKALIINDGYSWPEIVGQTLEVGDSIRGVCSVASAVTLRLSGREIT
jgi:hypothetical protein